jgi:hypothetical protein
MVAKAAAQAATTLTVSRRELHDAIRACELFAARDEYRTSLNGVFLAADRNDNFVAVACDGHTLCKYASALWRDDCEAESIILRLHDCKRLAALVKPAGRKDDSTVTVELVSEFLARVDGAELSGVREVFPPYAQVIPAHTDEGASYWMQAQYLERVGKALRYLRTGNNETYPRVQGGGNEPIRFDCAVPTGGTATIVIMPCSDPSK